MNIKQILGYQPTLYVDDGHGENTTGKRTPIMSDGTVIKENQFNQAVSKTFGKKAEKIGFRVVYTAPEDWDVPLKIRTDRANEDLKRQMKQYPRLSKEKVAVFISFHYNAFNGKFDDKKGGVETYHYPTSQSGKRLASLIHQQVIKGTDQFNRGVKAANFHVLRETMMTAVLLEAGFMDKLEEAKLMLDEDFQDEVATETLKGVCDYFGVAYEKLVGEDKSNITNDSEEIQKLKQEINRLLIENDDLKAQLDYERSKNAKIEQAMKSIVQKLKDFDHFIHLLLSLTEKYKEEKNKH